MKSIISHLIITFYLIISTNSFSQIFLENGNYELLENDSLAKMQMSLSDEYLSLMPNQKGENLILIVENLGWKTDVLIYQYNLNELWIKNFKLPDKKMMLKDSKLIKDIKLDSEIDSLKGFYQILSKNASTNSDKQFKIISVYSNDILISRLVFHDINYSTKNLPYFSIIKSQLDLLNELESHVEPTFK